jgi:hypothetical protein
MAKTLPRHLTLPKARKAKAEAFASLTERELELLLVVEPRPSGLSTSPRGCLFGGRKGTSCVVTLRTVTVKLDKALRRRRKTTEERTRTDELPILLGLERAGWLRFAEMSLPGEDPTGYYWLTDSAETVLRACREGKRPLLSN